MAMRKRLGFVAGILLAVATTQAFAAQPTEQQVRQLMDAIGLGKSLSQMNSQVATSMKQALPCVSSNYWQGYIDDNSSKDFVSRLVPIYQKHFTADEVDGMVKFYSSPLGQKVLTEMPLALAEANQAGQQWSHDHTQQMIAKLEQAGTLGADGRCPASFAGGPASAGSAAAASDDSSPDAATDAADVAVATHVTSSRHHGHTPIKRHTTTKKAASAKKASATRKSAPVKAKTSSKTPAKHHATTKKPASGTPKTTPASQ
ncbi:DUF2059 domain-containing protein [Rhodanobacter sp. BL-MT-08]